MSQRATDLLPGQQIGPYRIESKIGQGGMGVVYRALHTQIERPVAIKILYGELAKDAQAVQRFLNEARAVNRVHHPSLVQISDYGQLSSGEPYIIMEFLQGRTLREYLEDAAQRTNTQGRLPPSFACVLCREIALTIVAAHSKGIVHRDLKPDNVMLVPDPRREGTLQIKLLDFGIAKILPGERPSSPDEATSVGMMLGTPAYMSPEQVRGDGTVSAPADVYALGVMLYQMLSGSLPFTGPAAGILGKHLYEAPPSLAERVPELDKDLVALTHRMLEKDPASRPTMAQVAAALRSTARGHRGHELSRAPDLRRRLLTIGGAAVFVLVLLLGVGMFLRERSGPVAVPLSTDPATPSCSVDGWCRLKSPVSFHLRGVAVSRAPRKNIWVVGDQGTLLQGEEESFRTLHSGTTQKLLSVVVAQAPNRDPGILAVGEQGTFLSGTAVSVRQVPLPLPAYLTAIQLGEGGQVWIAGKGGTLLSGRLGGVGSLANVEPVPLGTPENLYGLFAFKKVDGAGTPATWVVGRGGVAFCIKEGDTVVRTVPTGVSTQLKGIYGTTSEDLWAVGKEGTLLHFDGSVFTKRPVSTSVDLNAISGIGRERIFIVGDQGTILSYKNGMFVPMQSGVTLDLSGVFVAGDEVWAVGDGGVILRHRG